MEILKDFSALLASEELQETAAKRRNAAQV